MYHKPHIVSPSFLHCGLLVYVWQNYQHIAWIETPKNENQDSKGMEKNSFKVWLFSDCNFVRVSFFTFCPILLFLCLSLRWIVVIVLLLLFQVDFTSFCRSSKPGNNNRFSNQIKCFMQHPTTSKKCQSSNQPASQPSNQPRQLTTIDNIVNAIEFKQELPGQH